MIHTRIVNQLANTIITEMASLKSIILIFRIGTQNKKNTDNIN